jgi:hypothetical protein
MGGEKTINTPVVLERTFKLADAIYNKLFNTGEVSLILCADIEIYNRDGQTRKA